MVSSVDNYNINVSPGEGMKWEACLEDLKTSLNTQSFSSWFSPLQFCSNENNVLTLAAPNKFHIEFIEYNYWDTLSPIIDRHFPANKKVQFIINTRLQADRENTVGDTGWQKSAAPSPLSAASKPEPPKPDVYSTFNSRFTFEEFVEGPHNQFAKVAASSVSENPGRTYNPSSFMAAPDWARLICSRLLEIVPMPATLTPGSYMSQLTPLCVILSTLYRTIKRTTLVFCINRQTFYWWMMSSS